MLPGKNAVENPRLRSLISFYLNILAIPTPMQGCDLGGLVANVSDCVEGFAGAVREIYTFNDLSVSSPLTTRFDTLLQDFRGFQESMLSAPSPLGRPPGRQRSQLLSLPRTTVSSPRPLRLRAAAHAALHRAAERHVA